MTAPPKEAAAALAAIRAVGGDELVRAMVRAFAGFAAAQLDWMERQLGAGKLDVVGSGARALRISALQVGAQALADACERAELAGGGRDAGTVTTAVADITKALAAARPWMDALAAEPVQTP